MSVVIRKRKHTKDGKISLYLDIYKGTQKINGKTKSIRDVEYLKLYLFQNPINETEKKHNKDIFELAEKIRATRELEILTNEYGFKRKNKYTNFSEYYYNKIINKTTPHYKISFLLLTQFAGDYISTNQIDNKFCEDFQTFIKSQKSKHSKISLKPGTVNLYFVAFTQIVKMAVEDNILSHNPLLKIKHIKNSQTKKVFLTENELRLLTNTN